MNFLNLVPLLLFLIFWCMFMTFNDMMVKLVTLLYMTIFLPLMFMNQSKMFWPYSLLLILISTGLMVIFAYIVSLHLKVKDSMMNSKTFYLNILLLLASLILLKWEEMYDVYLSVKFSTSFVKSIMMPTSSTLTIVAILLILVIIFMRLIYSKGGGFRKKF